MGSSAERRAPATAQKVKVLQRQRMHQHQQPRRVPGRGERKKRFQLASKLKPIHRAQAGGKLPIEREREKERKGEAEETEAQYIKVREKSKQKTERKIVFRCERVRPKAASTMGAPWLFNPSLSERSIDIRTPAALWHRRWSRMANNNRINIDCFRRTQPQRGRRMRMEEEANSLN